MYIPLSTVLKYRFEVLLLYWSISNLEYFKCSVLLLLVHDNYLKTLVTRYFADINDYIIKHTLTTVALFYT